MWKALLTHASIVCDTAGVGEFSDSTVKQSKVKREFI